MKIHDISMLIEPEMLVYKDKPSKRPVFVNMANHKEDNYHETKMEMDIHCGTHIDMPLHMIDKGGTLDDFDFNRLITPCKVFDVTKLKNPVITAKDIKKLDIDNDDFVIFKTNNSYRDKKLGFDYDFVYVDESAAKLLKDKGVNGVGIDALGIERSQDGHPTHKILLEDNVIILEGLELKDIDEGEYYLAALPIKLKGTEGSWVRAVLVELENR